MGEKYKEINACPNGCLGPKSCSNRLAGIISECCSSTNPLTERQRRALEKRLNESASNITYKVVTAMRYWNPSTDDALDELEKHEVDELILLPLYPQFSYSTTASSFNEFTRRLKVREQEEKWKIHHITKYHLNDFYIQSISQRIDEG